MPENVSVSKLPQNYHSPIGGHLEEPPVYPWGKPLPQSVLLPQRPHIFVPKGFSSLQGSLPFYSGQSLRRTLHFSNLIQTIQIWVIFCKTSIYWSGLSVNLPKSLLICLKSWRENGTFTFLGPNSLGISGIGYSQCAFFLLGGFSV